MDYSSPANQLYALLHYGFSFFLLMVLWPKFLFAQSSGDRLEDRVALYGKAVCLYIILGYLLVVTKLYEVIAIALVLLLISTRKYWRRGSAADREQAATAFSVWFYELTEFGFRIKSRWKAWRGALTMARKEIRLKSALKGDSLLFLVLGGVMAASVYFRFYDSTHTAAPGTSDGIVMLAWMKYIDLRQLFTDGVYPQGFPIYMSLLGKFAAIDRLYILKYTGPLNGTLTVFGLYFAISRLTGNKGAGVLGAAMFGLGGLYVFGEFDWMRQAASNAQEFALVFVFPAFYFTLRYLEQGTRRDLWNGIAFCAAAGFVHTLIFAYIGMGIGVALIAAVLVYGFRRWRRYFDVSLLSLITVAVTYVPLQLGQWFGVGLHGTSASFLVATAEQRYAQMTPKDYIGLASIAIIAISMAAACRDRSRKLYEWFAVGLGTATFLLYYWVPVYTKSVVLASRTSSMWTVCACFTVGFAWWSIWRLIPPLNRKNAVQIVLSGAAALAFALYVQVTPAVPYKMQSDSEVRMYLKIASIHRPFTWTIFTTNVQSYALIFDNGFHQYLRTLIDQYDPTGTPITRQGQNEYDRDVTPWMYVFQPKKAFKLDPSNFLYPSMTDQYAQEEQETRDLEAWIAKYEPVHGRPPIVYEDDELRVYLLERPDATDKRIRRLWGYEEKKS